MAIPGSTDGNTTILDTFCNVVDFGSNQFRKAQESPTTTIAVLEDTGRLLDDGPVVLGAGIENRCNLALVDDHVLMAPHTTV